MLILAGIRSSGHALAYLVGKESSVIERAALVKCTLKSLKCISALLLLLADVLHAALCIYRSPVVLYDA